MHSITLNQNWKIVRVTLDPPQKGPSRKCNEPILALCLWGFRRMELLRGPVQISSKIKIIPRLVTSTFQVCTSDYVERMMWQH